MRRFNLFILTVFAALSLCPDLWARQLSENEAQRIAEQFQRELAVQSRASLMGSATLKLAYTASQPASKAPAFYVFNRNEADGFIIVAADDRVREVLGYTTGGTFDLDLLPPSLVWWLGQYEQQIEAALATPATTSLPSQSTTSSSQNSIFVPSYPVGDNDNTPSVSVISNPAALSVPGVNLFAPKAANYQEIAPLVKTQWNQIEPFNDRCPIYNQQRSVTGCVATAMAQIMKYHNFPERGTGSYSYTTKTTNQNVSCNFGSTVFNWANMTETYDGNSTEAQKEAVATLMFACGVSVNMNYSPGESGAMSFAVPWALQKYFGYSGDSRIVERLGYTDDEWNELIYNELASGRPVMYSGRADNGGHAFICDGYSGDGFFHINWGWGGSYDGDFLLTALNPDGQGTGGYVGDYNSEQTAVIGIEPSNGGNNIGQNFCVVSKGSFEYVGQNTFLIDGAVYTVYPEDVAFPLGIVVVSQDGSENEQFFWSDYIVELPAADIVTGNFYLDKEPSFVVKPEGLQPGKYLVYPAYKCPDGSEIILRCPIEKHTCLDLTVADDGSLDYGAKESEFQPKLEITSIVATPDKILSKQEFRIKFTIKNSGTGMYNDDIFFHFREKESESDAWEFYTGIQMAPGKESTYTMGPITHEFDPGKYIIYVTDNKNEVVSTGDFSLTVTDGNETTPLWVNSISETVFYKGIISNISLNVTNSTSADITSQVYVNIYNSEGKKINFGDGYGGMKFTFSANSTKDYVWPFFGISEYAPGEYTIVMNDGKGNDISEPIRISIYYEAEALWYSLDIDKAIIAKAPKNAYSGDVTVPATIKYDGTDYPVALIKDGAFAGCSDIKNIFLYPAVVPFENAAAVFTDLPDDATFYVAPEAYSDYAFALADLGRKVYSPVATVGCSLPEAIYVGQEFAVTIQPEPAGVHINPEFDVKVADSEIAEFVSLSPIADDGSLTATFLAKKAGESKLTLQSAQPGVEAVETEFTVTTPPVTGITLSDVTLTLDEGSTYILQATLQPSAAVGTVTWSSSDEAVATVDTEGKITAVAEGTAIISASCGELSAECKVTVRRVAVPVTGITLSESEITIDLKDNSTVQLSVSFTPEGADTPELVWSSSDEAIATVDSEGIVTGIAEGNAVITVSVVGNDELSATCQLTVKDTTGIGGIGTDGGITVKGVEGAVEVTGAPENSMVEIYTSSGYLVASQRVGSGMTLRIGLSSGYYIVRIGSTVVKVII